MAQPVATVITRRLPYPWGINILRALFEGVEAEGHRPKRIYVSPQDFTSYGNLLLGLPKHTIFGTPQLDGKFTRLDFMGCPVIQVQGWPAGTLGYVVEVG